MLGFITKTIGLPLSPARSIFWPLESWVISQPRRGHLLDVPTSGSCGQGLLGFFQAEPVSRCFCLLYLEYTFPSGQALIVLTKAFPTVCLHCPWSGGNWLPSSTPDYRCGAGVPGPLLVWAIFWYSTLRWDMERVERKTIYPEADSVGLVVWPTCVWILVVFHFPQLCYLGSLTSLIWDSVCSF